MERKQLQKQMTEWRHALHRHPETAFEEKQTAAFVAQRLREMGLTVREGIGGTGVLADLKVGEGERIIGLRADMDAISLKETGTPEYVSQCPGKMHACGHDGHTATLLGAASLLSQERNFDGTVRFIFQPAEEPGKGAAAMIADGLLSRYPVDEIYGLHNAPFLPAGEIHTRVGGIMASEDNFVIRIKGKGGHASSPHMGVDPMTAAAELILALQTIVSRNVSPLEQAVISCTELHTDGAHNAIPSHVEILGDTRSCTDAVQELIEVRMRTISQAVCEMNGVGCEFQYTHEFAPTVNWEACTKAAVEAARAVVGTDKVNGACTPWMASEDFGTFLQRVPGCFVFLGSGTCAKAEDNIMVHHSAYDYNDDVLLTGAEFFAELVRRRLNKGGEGNERN